MKLTNLNELKPFITRISFYGYDMDNNKINKYIDNITDILKYVADELNLDYDKLYKDLKNSKASYFSDPEKTGTAMYCSERYTSIIDNSKYLWYVIAVWNEYDGTLVNLEKGKCYARLDLDQLIDIPWSDRNSKIQFKRSRSWVHKSKPVEIDEVISFYGSIDSLTPITGRTYGGGYKGEKTWISYIGLSLFTTEEEANNFYDECKRVPIVKSQACINEENRIEETYGPILKLARKLTKDQLIELTNLIDKIKYQKIKDTKLNSLKLAQEYLTIANEYHDYILPEGNAIRDWVTTNWYPNRYETIKYSDILEHILGNYKEDVKWVNIKKSDKEVIKALADELSTGMAGFKFDW